MTRHIRRIAVWLPLLCVLTAHAELSVRVSVRPEEVFAGEPFILQIRVSGDEEHAAPDVSALRRELEVGTLDPSRSESSYTATINGRRTHTVRRDVVYPFRVIARTPGTVTVPPIPVRTGDREILTEAVTVRVMDPAEGPAAEMSLEAAASTERCFVGETVTLTWTWRVSEQVGEAIFDIPFLKTEAFEFPDVPVGVDASRPDDYRRFPLSDGSLEVGRVAAGRLNGKEAVALTIRKVAVARKPGLYSIDPATVVCAVVTGYTQSRGRNERVFGKAAVRSAALRIAVDPLPEEGRPTDFSGIVGTCRVEATADRTEVNVGDPIALTVRVSGPAWPDRIELPALDGRSPLAGSFRVSEEQEPGVVDGEAKVFRRVLRAIRPDVTEIPAIGVSYFDSSRGAYGVARSEAIPLTVRPTRVLTAADAEGVGPAAGSGSEVRGFAGGIAHNYEDLSVIAAGSAGPEVWLSSPVRLWLLAVPPLLVGLFAAWTHAGQRRAANPGAEAARRAGRVFRRRIRGLESAAHPSDVLCEALREYLGARLGTGGRSLTSVEADRLLGEAGVSQDAAGTATGLLARCEAARYGGGAGAWADGAELKRAGLAAVTALESELRRSGTE